MTGTWSRAQHLLMNCLCAAALRAAADAPAVTRRADPNSTDRYKRKSDAIFCFSLSAGNGQFWKISFFSKIWLFMLNTNGSPFSTRHFSIQFCILSDILQLQRTLAENALNCLETLHCTTSTMGLAEKTLIFYHLSTDVWRSRKPLIFKIIQTPARGHRLRSQA